MSMMDASRNASSRLASMGMGNNGDPGMDQGKAPMAAVHYRPAQDPTTACAACKYADQQGGCQLVAGQIQPTGTCDLFEPAQQVGPQPGAVPPAVPPAAPGPQMGA